MKLLLDTHIAVWLATDERLLTAAERALVADPAHELCLSVISIWEVRTKGMADSRRGREGVLISVSQFAAFFEAQRIQIVPLDASDCTTALAVPIVHNDPFDDMLLVHAQRLSARMVTRDAKLRDHPLAYHP